MLLDAALAVFTERGYTDASIAEIVEGADSSVGSLYHHFSGKNELYLTLWERWQSAQEDRVSAAVETARATGEKRGPVLLIAAARGFLEGSWADRTIGSLFFNKDGPPGFEATRRERLQTWLRDNLTVVNIADGAISRVSVAVLTTILGEANREVMASKSQSDAEKIIDAVIEMITVLQPDLA